MSFLDYDAKPWERQKWERIPSLRKHIARHEAHHAVASFIYGGEIKKLAVPADNAKRGPGDLPGWMQAKRTGDDFDDLVVDLIGEVANRILTNGDLRAPQWEKPNPEKIGPLHDLDSAFETAPQGSVATVMQRLSELGLRQSLLRGSIAEQ